MKLFCKVISVFLAVFFLISTSQIVFANEKLNFQNLNEYKLPNIQINEMDNVVKYKDYIKKTPSQKIANKSIDIDLSKTKALKGNCEVLNPFEGFNKTVIKTDENTDIECEFNVIEEGLYNIGIDYFNIKGKGSDIERQILIDGKYPFAEMNKIVFPRMWKNETNDFKRDANENDLRPTQVEIYQWNFKYIDDTTGLNSDDFLFYFSAGLHTITIKAQREPMVIGGIYLKNKEQIKSYNKVEKGYSNIKSIVNKPIILQAEKADIKSSSMIYPLSDRTSAATVPSDPAKIRLNILGGSQWQQVGQFAIWKFDVKETGYYKIAIKNRQNYNNGLLCSRDIYIDDKIPFKEFEAVSFSYDAGWRMSALGNETPYLFYLEEGKHELKIEVNLGKMSQIIDRANSVMIELNNIYRNILMITGPSPDIYRDYQFNLTIPDVIENINKQTIELQNIYHDIIKTTGQNGENAQIFKKLFLQTEEMYKDPEQIPKIFDSFKINIASLGTWYSIAKTQPLDLDYIAIAGKDEKLPNPNSSVADNIAYNLKSFIASFFEDYNVIGEKAKSAITVWIGNGVTGGRDQAQVLKQMINNRFTSQSGIHVNLELVPMGSMLPATMAKKGPDVALTLGSSEPMNYALRNSAVDLKQFNDFDEVSNRFSKSSLEPMEFNGKVYGLPESQTWNMLFYRKDILRELDLSIPQTWDEVVAMLPVLQQHQLNFALPAPISDLMVGIGMSSYAMFLFQNNGNFYNEEGTKALISTNEGINAFYDWTRFYKLYSLDISLDFPNRFRTGEIPIGVADYSLYNQLSVFAPEIAGQWGFAPVPGVKNEDGTINRSVAGNVTASMILQNAKDKKACWEFVKWWTSTSIQVEFAGAIESIMGPAGRYTPANIEALYQIPWSKSDFETLMYQWQYVKGIREVPGGYYMPRYLDFAFKKVVNRNADISDSLLEANEIIDLEIATKRKAFGLN